MDTDSNPRRTTTPSSFSDPPELRHPDIYIISSVSTRRNSRAASSPTNNVPARQVRIFTPFLQVSFICAAGESRYTGHYNDHVEDEDEKKLDLAGFAVRFTTE